MLLAGNPLAWHLFRTASGMLPDSAAYLVFGPDLLAHGRLALEGWAHVDAGVVLPPVYPLLAGLLAQFTGDRLVAALWVSVASMVLASFALYALVTRLADWRVALVAALAAQLNYYYAWFGSAALTEAPFLLLLLLGLLLSVMLVEAPRRTGIAAALGVVSALLVMTRQIGVLLPAAAVLALFTARPAVPGAEGMRARLRAVAAITAGFAAAGLPYAVALHAQTGHHPFTQHYRLGHYTVTDPEVRAVEAGATYLDEFARRRDARALNADASEMRGYVAKPAGGTAGTPWPARAGASASATAGTLTGTLGWWVAALAALALASALLPGSTPARRAIPCFLLLYLGLLTALGSQVDRYIQILFPVFIALAAVEVRARVAPLWPGFRPGSAAPLTFCLALGAALLAGQPLFTSARWHPWSGLERSILHRTCHDRVVAGDPAFALHAGDALLAGLRYRILPNDGFDRVARYAKRTGVHWLVLTRTPAAAVEHSYYGNAPWLGDLLQGGRPPEGMREICVTADGRGSVYRFD